MRFDHWDNFARGLLQAVGVAASCIALVQRKRSVVRGLLVRKIADRRILADFCPTASVRETRKPT